MGTNYVGKNGVKYKSRKDRDFVNEYYYFLLNFVKVGDAVLISSKEQYQEYLTAQKVVHNAWQSIGDRPIGYPFLLQCIIQKHDKRNVLMIKIENFNRKVNDGKVLCGQTECGDAGQSVD